MPFINGRYYMNPAYGRAVEAAREGEKRSGANASVPSDDPWEENAAGHWITKDSHHILIDQGLQRGTAKSAVAKGPSYKEPNARNRREVELANVVYNETSGLRVDPNARPGAAGSAEDLQNARIAIAEVANRVIEGGHPERILAATDLSTPEVEAINGGNPQAIAAHNSSLEAAKQALAGSSVTNGATQYRTRFGGDVTTPIGRTANSPGARVSQHFGPFPAGRGQREVVVVAR